MLDATYYIETTGVDPYKNLAVEEYLFTHCPENNVLFYLWQNQKTVVIGKNQNAWKECQISRIETDEAVIARRLSGGGAVYHDLGNLNFTFIAHKENYDVAHQQRVLLHALQILGIRADISGRNDILVNGCKFSGNAFHEKKGHCYHHGTIMVDVELDKLENYLNVSQKKLESKGIASVRSRVINLKEVCPDLTIHSLKEALKTSFDQCYDRQSLLLREEDLDPEKIKTLTQKYASWDWIYGQAFDFQYTIGHRFTWGEVELQFQVDAGMIMDVMAYSDSLRPNVIQSIPAILRHHRYHNETMAQAMGCCHSLDRTEETMYRDMETWLKNAEL